MPRIKILYVIGSSGMGGAEKLLYLLVKNLNKKRFETYIACPPGGFMFERFQRYANQVEAMDFRNWVSPKRIYLLKEYIESKGIDIVHTHLYSTDFLGIIAARLAGAPHILSTVHGHNFSDFSRPGLRSAKNALVSLFYRSVYALTQNVITVCRELKTDLSGRFGIKVSPDKIRVIYSGIEINRTGGVPEYGENDIEGRLFKKGLTHIGVVGNLDRVKGQHILMKAIPMILKKAPDVRFLFVGSGQEMGPLKRLARGLGINEHVVFTGAYPDADRIMELCDIIVLPSLNEGLPLTMLEAMAVGKPVVAARVGGVPEAIEDGKTGLLVQPNDPKAMAEAIISLLGDRKSAIMLGENAKEKMRGYFTLESMIKETESFYEGIIDKSAFSKA